MNGEENIFSILFLYFEYELNSGNLKRIKMKYIIFNFMKSINGYTFFSLIVLVIFSLPFFVSAGTGTIQGSTKFAWSNNVGYINFAPVVGGIYYGLMITDSTVTGYAWSANSGWIKFSDFTNPNVGSEAGVKNNGGVLFGYAWGANLGWINFTGVTINTSTGKFSGTAGGTGTLIGTLKFDDCPILANCNVATDWRPTPIPVVVNSEGAALLLALPASLPVPTTPPEPVIFPDMVLTEIEPEVKSLDQLAIVSQPNEIPLATLPVSEFPPTSLENPVHVETLNEAMIIVPSQSGTYTQSMDQGGFLLIDMPANNVSEPVVINAVSEKLSSDNNFLVAPNINLKDGSFYNITVKKIADGEEVHSFSQSITITLPVSKELNGKENLAVYWLDEVKNEWIVVPDAVFLDNKVIFQVNHLTRFAIFKIPEGKIPLPILSIEAPSVEPIEVKELAQKKFSLIISLIISSIIFISGLSFILWKKKARETINN